MLLDIVKVSYIQLCIICKGSYTTIYKLCSCIPQYFPNHYLVEKPISLQDLIKLMQFLCIAQGLLTEKALFVIPKKCLRGSVKLVHILIIALHAHMHYYLAVLCLTYCAQYNYSVTTRSSYFFTVAYMLLLFSCTMFVFSMCVLPYSLLVVHTNCLFCITICLVDGTRCMFHSPTYLSNTTITLLSLPM